MHSQGISSSRTIGNWTRMHRLLSRAPSALVRHGSAFYANHPLTKPERSAPTVIIIQFAGTLLLVCCCAPGFIFSLFRSRLGACSSAQLTYSRGGRAEVKHSHAERNIYSRSIFLKAVLRLRAPPFALLSFASATCSRRHVTPRDMLLWCSQKRSLKVVRTHKSEVLFASLQEVGAHQRIVIQCGAC
jgi:hypothetical protein